MLCNDMQWEGVKTSPGLEAWLFRYVPLHKIRYGVQKKTTVLDGQVAEDRQREIRATAGHDIKKACASV
jgi:hypothetical protein